MAAFKASSRSSLIDAPERDWLLLSNMPPLCQASLDTSDQSQGVIRNMLEIVRHLVPDGPKTVGPFHHAVTAGDYHFITGQMPTMPDDPTKVVEGGIEAQTRRVMDNLALVLSGLDSSFDRVVFARVYLVNFQDFDRMNAVYTTYFSEGQLPSRTCIGVTGLAVGALVEIDLIAAR